MNILELLLTKVRFLFKNKPDLAICSTPLNIYILWMQYAGKKLLEQDYP